MDFKIIKRKLAEILFPRDFTCDICGVETFNDNLCPQCKKTVIFNTDAVCPLCGRRTVRPEICLECKDVPPSFHRAVSAIVHEDGDALLVKKFKNGNGYLKEFFADVLSEKIKDLPKIDGLVFVPMTKKAIRKRGYNQAALLADSLSVRINVPLFHGALEKVKDTREQKSLTKKERLENLKSCFRITDKNTVYGKVVLIIDDVLTTGATAETITDLLFSAGAKDVFLATVSSVEYKIKKDLNASDIRSGEQVNKKQKPKV